MIVLVLVLHQRYFGLNIGFFTGEERPYRSDIDGLRAVAVLSVILYHLSARWLPGGFVGVDIFFVISGFVVSASLLHARRDRFHHFVSFFYARRLARIGPALGTGAGRLGNRRHTRRPAPLVERFRRNTAIYAFFGLSNWAMENNVDTYFAPRAEFNPYTHTWSLGVEEQFYLVFPFLFFAWVTLRERKSAQRLATALTALLGLASFIACISGCNRQETRRTSCCNLFLPPVSPFCLMRPNPYFGALRFAARTCSMPPTPFVGEA